MMTVLDLGSVKIIRPSAPSAEATSRSEQATRANEEFRRAIRDQRRRRQNGNALAGVTESETVNHWDTIRLEAYGLTPEAVKGAIAAYERKGQGSNPHRFNIRFFAIKPDPDGGFAANGTAYRENF